MTDQINEPKYPSIMNNSQSSSSYIATGSSHETSREGLIKKQLVKKNEMILFYRD